MSKLTRAQRATLSAALGHIAAARDYIMGERTAVCAVASAATTTLHYTRPIDGRILYEVERSYGSNLCQINTGIAALERLLAEP
jgi:hypothetical protein